MKRLYEKMTKEEKKYFIEAILKSVPPQECHENCSCGAECSNRIYIARKGKYNIMQCMKCGKIQVVYR